MPNRPTPFASRWILLAAACAALVLAGAPAHAAPPDAALLAAARAAEPAVIASLQDMVAIESGSASADGLARMADYVDKRLQALGARTERIAPTQGGSPIVKGSFTGSGSAKIMLMAHMDTVYANGILAAEPFRQEGNKLYGPGIADDKGGIAVILHTLALLQAAGWKDYAQLTVLFNADEEVGSGGSGERIAALADMHDAVLSFEPTGAKDVTKVESVLLGAAGTATATLTVQGRTSHAGAAPDLGRNALIELAHQLQQTRDVAKDIPGAQLNWTTASAGTVRNQIPGIATAGADVRITQPGAAEKLQAALSAKVAAAKLVPETTSSIKLEIGRPPFLANDRAKALAVQAQAIYAELDERPLRLVPMTGGATDAAFAGRSGKALVLEGLGLAGWGYHARNEYIEIDSIVPRLYLAARLLQNLGRGR